MAQETPTLLVLLPTVQVSQLLTRWQSASDLNNVTTELAQGTHTVLQTLTALPDQSPAAKNLRNQVTDPQSQVATFRTQVTDLQTQI